MARLAGIAALTFVRSHSSRCRKPIKGETVMLARILHLARPAAAIHAGALLLSAHPAKAEWPGILEAKDIAEEGFI
jgi:hypothetical protein